VIVGASRIVLRIDGARTLKEKRAVVKSLVERTRARFHVAVAEVGDLDRAQDAIIGVAAVGNQWRHVQSCLDAAVRFIGASFPVELVDVRTERL
jgi:uncharacterized protein YlxP (DUF503 family)